MTDLLIPINWKKDSYNSIFVIVARLTKVIYYKPVQIIIDITNLAEVMFNVIIQYHGLPDFIVNNKESFFTFNFRSSLYYFLENKQKLSIVFYP